MKKNYMEEVIDFILRAGATTSAAFLAAGLLTTFLTAYGPTLGNNLILTGILVLFATPVARVSVSIFMFAAERNLLYTVITTIVLVNILIAIFIVPFVLHLWAP
jgi:uncharacterized membrane protein